VPARPPKSEAQQKQPALFEAQDRDWFAKAVAYHLGAFPPLAEFAPWYPAVIAAYFARQSWHRQGDPEQAVCTWAMDFHKLGACETEIRAALEWSIETHDKAKHGFGRPDHLRRIKARIVTARQQAATPAARSRGPQDEAAEQAARQSFEEQWAAMAESERRDIEEHVIAGNPLFRRADLNRQGWTFRSAVKAFLEASTSACTSAEALAAPARPGAAGSAGACTAAGPSSGGSPPAGCREQSG